MSVKLRNDDAQAVDLLLDRAAAAQGNGNGNHLAGFTTSHAGVSNERVAAVEQVLNVLNAMPATDPASDLLRRTLERVDRRTDAPLRGTTSTHLIDLGRPVA